MNHSGATQTLFGLYMKKVAAKLAAVRKKINGENKIT